MDVPAPPATSVNFVLEALPAAERRAWRGQLEPVFMRQGEALGPPQAPLSHVYFPLDCVLVLRCDLSGGQCVDFAHVGREGFVGALLARDRCPAGTRAMVLVDGLALRAPRRVLDSPLANTARFGELARAQTRSLLGEAAQSALCYRYHSATQQLCRLLLSCRERTGRLSVTLTHQSLAASLGIRRESVSEAAGRLQRDGLIECERGRVHLRDLAALESLCCECLTLLRSLNQNFFGGGWK